MTKWLKNDTEVEIFRWLEVLSFSLNLFTFLNAAYNCIKYLYARKVNKVLVILFYVFVFTATSVHMC